ncbi:MAG TPA: hypothetical protein VIY70_14420 [Acidimicrobiia bacterium]
MLPFRPLLADTVLSDIHSTTGWIVVVVLGVVGLWGVILGVARRDPGRGYWSAASLAFTLGILQVALGVYLFSVEGIEPGNQHLFYGVVLMVTFAFVYVYRAQFATRPALYYGLVLLFSMGLGLRGIMTFGQSFGG